MVSDDDFKKVCVQIAKLKAQIDHIEVTMRSMEPVQSVVGAAGCGVKQGESGVGAGRQTIAKKVQYISNCLWWINRDCVPGESQTEFDNYCKTINEHLEAIEAAAQEQDVP